MAVAVATGQSGGTPNWQAMEASPPERMEMAHERIMGAAEHSFGQMNAAQASWSVMATRRSTPAWIQRLGAFFQEMRSQQTAWPPSPLGSPPARPMQSQRGSPEMEQRGWGSPVFLSPEQQEQFRRMEQRAPLLYGPPRGERQPEGNGSSGGSTYEAVPEEVKRRKIYDKKWSFCVQREDRILDWSASRGGDWRHSRLVYQRGIGRTSNYAYNRGVGFMCRTATSTGPGGQMGQAIPLSTGLGEGISQQLSAAPTGQGPQSAATMIPGAMTGSGGATAGSSDPMSRLLEGLEKVIKGGKPEELSKAVDAPKLPEISESSSVDFGDWLYLIEHVMSDLSTSSAEWWATVVKDAQDFYERYQAADQFSRLSMKPTASPTLNEVRWSRLDRRGATILLGATPDDIKKELVATRTRTTLEVLARLMVIYRPGSALEKGQLLRRIESPDTAATVQEAIEGLRQWLRHYQRARDLKLSVPDPSVTLRGIDQLVKKPIQESVLAVHRALLAEFEQMGFKKKAKQVQEGPHGCYANVTFVYWERSKDLSKAERRDRCYECGAKGHMAMACPTRKEAQQKAVSAGDSPMSSTGGTSGRGAKGGKGQRVGDQGDAGVPQSATTSTTTPTPTATATETPVQGVPVEQLIEDAQKLMKAFMEQKAQPTVQALRVDESVFTRRCEAPALREFMKQNEDLIRMNRMGLLDSGATHPLRARNERDQPGTMDNVNVTLAGETRVQMEQNKAGTFISHQDAQPIVPLGTLVKALGYEFVWDRKGCGLRHPDRKEVRVYTRSTCPEVMQCDALRLIAELEEAKLTETMSSLAQLKASVAAAREHQEKSWRDHVRDYVTSGVYEDGVKAVMCAPFMHHVPMRDQLQTIVPMPKDEGEAWQWMKRFPMNRAKRRTLWQTRDWTVHMFSGAGVKNDPLRDLPGLVEIDIKKGWDLNDDKIYGVVLWMAKEGRVKHVIGGPPAGTFAPWHYKKDQEGRHRPLRSTHEPWGLREGLNPDESSKVLNENVMLCKMVWLWLCAEAAHEGQEGDHGRHHVGFCMEYPEDPHNYMPEGEHRDACVSLWRTEFMKEFTKETTQ
ncbi:unnamed protein product [Symbiodinium necroappetens]|uniref:CCHC-type domain-containing protein n=1 Tax=Symbiodinium necroappetens TaxID=1628268 RepID=A0A812ZS56_9DINO|nr:unnamed protein product [Symbiodinium necroappetens]